MAGRTNRYEKGFRQMSVKNVYRFFIPFFKFTPSFRKVLHYGPIFSGYVTSNFCFLLNNPAKRPFEAVSRHAAQTSPGAGSPGFA
jgi:hypothetical protein